MVRATLLGLFSAVLAGFVLGEPVLEVAQTVHEDYLSLSLSELLEVEVVTAVKREQVITEAPSIVSVFSREDIHQMAAVTVVDILKYAPGIAVSMARDGSYRIAMRGVRAHGTILLLLDGQALNNIYDGSLLFDLPIDFVDQIEIIRGPGSALYGNNAVVGVINIRTNNHAANKISIKAGSEQSFGLSGNYSSQPHNALAADGIDADRDKNDDEKSSVFAIAAGYWGSDGANNPNTAHNVFNTDGWTQDSSRFIEDAYIRAAYEARNWQVSGFFLHREQGPWSGDEFDFGPDSEYRQDQLLVNASGQYILAENLQFQPRISADYLSNNDLKQSHPSGYIGNGNVFADGALTKEEYQTCKLELDAQFDYRFHENHRLLWGLVYSYQKILAYELQRNYISASQQPQDTFANHDELLFEQDDKTRTIAAGYVQAEFIWPSVSLIAGVRLDNYSDFGHTLNPRLAVVYQVNNQLSFKGMYATAFRAPTFKELYDNTRVGVNGFRGNTALQPQTIDTLELGFELTLASLLFRGNVFYNQMDDVIDEFDPVGGGARGDIVNTGNTETYGAEFEVSAVLGRFELFFNYSQFYREFTWSDDSLFDAECCRPFLQSEGEQELVNTPRIQANTGLFYKGRRFSAFVGLSYGGRSGSNVRSSIERQTAFSGDGIIIEDYLQGDIKISYRVAAHTFISISALNLGQDKFSDPQSSSSIDVFGKNGLSQPGPLYVLAFETEI